jgi:monoamine oxidase
VWTLRKEFPGFEGVEAGAARIRDDHLWTRRYLDHFDLPLEPFYPQEGHLVVKTDGNRKLMPRGLPSWQCHPVVTSGQLQAGGALEAFRGARWYGVPGGADRLPRKMASLLAERIQYAAEVSRLDRGEERVRVTYHRNGRKEERTAGRLVCSLPLTTLRSVELEPPLPPKKRRILQEVPYESAIRVFVEVSRSPWENRGMNGFGWSEEIGEVWQFSPGPGTKGASRLLVSYVRGDPARRLSRLEDPELTDHVVGELDTLFPGVAEHAGRTYILRWDRQRWSLGAQSLTWELEPPPPPELRRPAGPIHFAGEHVASPRSAGWMDGALESGWRAADAILKGQ